MSDEEPRHRLDPDRAAAAAKRAAAAGQAPGRWSGRPAPAPFNPRPYRWAVGGLAVLLVIAFSVYRLSSQGLPTPGVPPGVKLHFFAAPLARSNLNGDANLAPPCTPAGHDPRALNICLIARHKPLVLAFFSPSSKACVHEIDTVQSVASQFPAASVRFAAVAIRSSHAETAALVRSRHWKIPVAYDRDGAVGEVYDVEICPLVELAQAGGVVADRLIGEHWLARSALAARVRVLLQR